MRLDAFHRRLVFTWVSSVFSSTILQPFIDSVQYKPETEALLRLKMTHLLLSGEYVLGTSLSHMIGDADTYIHFLNDFSRVYQDLQPLLPRPIFDRQLSSKKKLNLSLPLIVHLSEKAGKKEVLLDRPRKEHSETDPINISFSSTQLTELHNLIPNNAKVTIHDTLCAYIIRTMNKHFFSKPTEYISNIHIVMNYRGICKKLAPLGYVGNFLITIPSSDFPDSLSLSDIAKRIRESIKAIRNEDLLEKWIVSVDILSRKLIKEDRISFIFGSNEFIFNSNWKYDWANEINFGMINQCRFHTAALFQFYFRIFRLNPTKEENANWVRDKNSAQIAFRNVY